MRRTRRDAWSRRQPRKVVHQTARMKSSGGAASDHDLRAGAVVTQLKGKRCLIVSRRIDVRSVS